MMKTIEWTGLYREGWGSDLHPTAYSHPAKVQPGLAKKIISHMIGHGYICPGQKIVDPFGGVAGFALSTMAAGLDYIGIELEQKFQRLGQGMDCPGFDKAYWRQYNQRGRKWNELNICPDCAILLDASGKDLPFNHWFGRVTREMPTHAPHRFNGNIERWARYGLLGSAVLVQGDSRRLTDVLGGVDGCISSPPFVESLAGGVQTGGILGQQARGENKTAGGSFAKSLLADYGRSPGQLGAMKEGDHTAVIDAVISSPPYAASLNDKRDGGGLNPDMFKNQEKHRPGPNAHNQSNSKMGYGDTDGNLGNLPSGDIDAVLSSPPYGTAVNGNGEGPGARFDAVFHSPENATKKSSSNGYGETAGNLGNMFDGCVSSPPFEDCNVSIGAVGNTPGMRQQIHDSSKRPESYGSTPANIGNQAGPTFWTAARTILEQLHITLKPGGYAAFVTGDYKRNGERVMFGEQWLSLCESVGFIGVEHIVCWKREPGPVQAGIFGNDRDTTVDRVSFFRRLSNRRDPENAILNEDVYIVRRPL
jgi:hypothetical protein